MHFPNSIPAAVHTIRHSTTGTRLRSLLVGGLLLSGLAQSLTAQNYIRVDAAEEEAKEAAEEAARQDPEARALLDEAKAKLLSLQSLVADFESTRGGSTKNFDKQSEIYLERPNKFRVERVTGAVVEERNLIAVSDGVTVTKINRYNFAAFEQPVRAENFYLGQNFLVQFFFDPKGISFDPTDGLWRRSISLFDTNMSAYDRDTRLILLGERTLEGRSYQVVEIKYSTKRTDIRQQIYVGTDKLVYQVDTYFDGDVYSQKYRNFRINTALPVATWDKERPAKMPLIETDPVRMGAEAPDFALPGHDGGEFTLEGLLEGKKGLYICVLDGEAAKVTGNADTHLAQMRVLQEMKDKYEEQGLAVVCIVGGLGITPDVKDEMMLNWMPDVSRFNYPIAIDIDIEKGIQSSAYHNLQLSGRNNLLLDAEGRVVFAARNFTNKVNQLAFYQAMAQIGFAISAAELESAAR
ncbi:hypothetical protein [Actomonas aquatica]|uniref:Thioredoxin domain-containing protein n=1 Tax=Actomonas aquatica TaxID=2866162 RepID=A0ABZ1C256_9BACT|nr:hypothetical protein [Opitutus sp. WL0086]WRQ85766.1 hypothetical protein K1X11_013220 [Opitutus sp. WL0086]